MQLFARRYDTAQLVQIEIEENYVVSTRAAAEDDARAEAAGPVWISPGFVDIQVNGFNGQEFSSLELTKEKVAEIVRLHYKFGVTGICPTLTTAGLDVLAFGLRTIAEACEDSSEINDRVLGIHLEGPYMSPEDGPRGAHPAEHCRRPEWEEFCRLQDAAGGRISLITMSVEFDEAPAFIEKVVASGVVVAIGHTAANGAQIRAAADAGAQLSTHLGNGAHRSLRRHPNYIWDQLAEDRLMASLIVDGHHLPPEVVKTFVRAKTPGRCILVSDVSGLAGLPVGKYTSSGCELEILPDGRLVIAGQDQLLAGASLPIGIGITNVMKFAELNLRQAVDMATLNPAALLNADCGGFRPGDVADFVLFKLSKPANCAGPKSLDVLATVADGQVVYGELPV